jgi:hypothetical protein
MTATEIFALVEKGLVVIGTLVEAGQRAAPAINALKDLVSGAQTGEITDEDLARTEALLDQMIAEFNQEIGG